jgi:uncharacterized protein DUF5677
MSITDRPPHLTDLQVAYFEVFEAVSAPAMTLFRELGSRRIPREIAVHAILAAALFGRLVEASQAVAFLVWRGFAWDAAILLRAALEALIRLRVASSKPEATGRMIYSDILEKIKFNSPDVEAAVEAASGELPPETKQELELLRRKLDELKRMWGTPKKITVAELAREADLYALYQTVYRFTSAYVHLSLRGIDEYVLKSEDGIPEAIRVGPTALRADVHIALLIKFLLQGMEAIGKLYHLPPPIGLREAVDRLRELEPDIPSNILADWFNTKRDAGGGETPNSTSRKLHNYQ